MSVAQRLAPGVDAETLRLLASELITNAVEHSGSTTIGLEVASTPVGVTVIVTDDGDGDEIDGSAPGRVDPAVPVEHGRGLYIVERLADRWGVVLGGGSRMVWFTLATGVNPDEAQR